MAPTAHFRKHQTAVGKQVHDSDLDPIERVWGILEKHWNGTIRNSEKVEHHNNPTKPGTLLTGGCLSGRIMERE